MPGTWSDLTVAAQEADPGSTLALYRDAIRIRHLWAVSDTPTVRWTSELDGCLAFCREDGPIVCMINTSRRALPLPNSEVILSSGPLDGDDLPPDTAVWLQR